MNKNLILASWILCVCCSPLAIPASGQSGASVKPGSSGQGNPDAEPSGLGFSIETEMFTYKSVEVNSEVIACDIARSLYQVTLADAPAGSQMPCTIGGTARQTPGVIIISSESSLLPDFKAWRADMATMSSLEAAADLNCKDATSAAPPISPSSPPASPGANSSSDVQSRGGINIPGPLPVGEAVSTFGDFLRLFSSSQSVTSVGGTVRDQALMNEVARQLRALHIVVLIPEIYSPNSLGGTAYASSPYLQNLSRIFVAYQQCKHAASTYPANDSHGALIAELITDLDSFLKGLVPPPADPKTNGGNGNGPSTGQAALTAPVQSHLAAVYAADGLAQQIGITGNSGPNAIWQHVLWLKALESGGSVIKDTNIFRTRMRYSGGAVDSYALFRLDGNLVCSGNVYRFQTPVSLKDLEKSFRASPEKDIVESTLLHSTCSALPGQSD